MQQNFTGVKVDESIKDFKNNLKIFGKCPQILMQNLISRYDFKLHQQISPQQVSCMCSMLLAHPKLKNDNCFNKNSQVFKHRLMQYQIIPFIIDVDPRSSINQFHQLTCRIILNKSNYMILLDHLLNVRTLMQSAEVLVPYTNEILQIVFISKLL